MMWLVKPNYANLFQSLACLLNNFLYSMSEKNHVTEIG